MKDPKETPPELQALPVVPEKPYQIVGLQLAERMPIIFEGREYDLANLSTQDADYLLGFPAQVPFLKKN